MDQLWRGLEQEISANHQFAHIGQHAGFADAWVHALTDAEALRRAGIRSPQFWLRGRWT